MSHPQCVGMAGEEVLWHGFDDQRAGWCWVKRPCRPLRLGQSPSRCWPLRLGQIAPLGLMLRCFPRSASLVRKAGDAAFVEVHHVHDAVYFADPFRGAHVGERFG